MSKKLIYTLGAVALLSTSCVPEDNAAITIVNPSPLELQDKPVIISRTSLESADSKAQYPVITNDNGDTIPSQLEDHNGDEVWDDLTFVIDIDAKDTLALSLSWTANQIDYPKRTSIRFGKRDAEEQPVSPRTSDTLYANQIYARLGYQPYQTDGPSWENDKVGFRHYFDGRNAKDLFGKLKPAISPEDVGISAAGAVEDNYHEMRDWGRDVLPVGNSAGLGGIGLMARDSLLRLGCLSADTVTNVAKSVFKINTEGPVHSSFSLHYKDWQPMEGKSLDVKENVHIWPGIYAYQNTVEISGIMDESLIVGLKTMPQIQPIELTVGDEWTILLTHGDQGYNGEWVIGMALILPQKNYLGSGEAPPTAKLTNTYYGKLEIASNTPLTYYAVAGWELAADKGFDDPDYFQDYVVNLAEQLAVELVVEVQ